MVYETLIYEIITTNMIFFNVIHGWHKLASETANSVHAATEQYVAQTASIIKWCYFNGFRIGNY